MTAKFQIIYWRDIPAQVKVKAGRERAGRPLSDRFPVAIDEAAMRAGLTDSTDYLAEWRNGEWQEREGTLGEILDALVAEIEAAYPPKRLRALIQNQGLEISAD
ncbi:MAG: virulence factor [Candidatus Promineifilaceae bacterium]|nr:virulence factor [Candidatus Promineifilaceae bacterium]